MRITSYKDFENVINYGIMALDYKHAQKIYVSFQLTRSVFTITFKNDYFICYFKNQIYSIIPCYLPYVLFDQLKLLIGKYGGWNGVSIIYYKSTRKELKKYE